MMIDSNVCEDVYLRDRWWYHVTRTGVWNGFGRAAVKRALWTGPAGPGGRHEAGGAGESDVLAGWSVWGAEV